jgi:hypothetical protein
MYAAPPLSAAPSTAIQLLDTIPAAAPKPLPAIRK